MVAPDFKGIDHVLIALAIVCMVIGAGLYKLIEWLINHVSIVIQ